MSEMIHTSTQVIVATLLELLMLRRTLSKYCTNVAPNICCVALHVLVSDLYRLQFLHLFNHSNLFRIAAVKAPAACCC